MNDDVSFDQGALTPDQEGRVRAELSSDERLIWTGRPVRPQVGSGCLVLGAILALVPGGVGLTCLGIAMEQRNAPGADAGYWEMGIAGVVVGLLFFGLSALAVRSSRKNAEQTCYAVTDRRAIVWVPEMGGLAVRSYYPKDLGSMYRKETADGTGSVIFQDLTVSNQKGVGGMQERGFLRIDQVRKIEELIRATLLPPNEPTGA